MVGGFDGRCTIDMCEGVVSAERIGNIDSIIWKSAKDGDSKRGRGDGEAGMGINTNTIGGNITVVMSVMGEESGHCRARNRDCKKLFTVM